MADFLAKTDPDTYSIDDLKRDGTTDDTQLIISSGDASLDEDARTTIGDALFRGLPRSFRGTELRFVFFFNLPSTKERPACSLLTLSPYKKVGGGVTAPRAIYQPVPEFGEEARRASYQGSMVLRLTVDAQGLPQDICVEQGMGMGLDERSIAAINTWKFEPGKENGIPVPVRISVETSFRLY